MIKPALLFLLVLVVLAPVSSAWADEAFGVESFGTSITSDVEGTLATQAGSHPYALTTAVMFNHVVTAIEEPPRVRTYGDPKDIEVNLPAGVTVAPRATEARCTEAELESREGPASCPNAAAVGVFSVYLDGIEFIDEPVYNMMSPPGVPAELGFDVAGIGLIMHVGGRLRTGGDYGLSADISGISDEHRIYGLELTLWGDPSAAGHDQERGLCTDGEAKQLFKETGIHESCPVERTTEPFLTLPTSCTGEPLSTSMSADSWQEPGALNPDGTPDLSDPRWRTATSSSPPLTGCDKLGFSPRLTVGFAEPEAFGAESPAGLDIDLTIPHEESVSGLAGADLKDATVTLPAGFAVSPSAAAGREACTPEEIGLNSASAPVCPDASILGGAKIVTPLLEAPLEGSVYLAQPYENVPAFGSPEHPGGSLLALYVVAESDGVLVKLAGHVEADPQTGRLTVTFDNDPQLPFGELRLSLYGGPRALLVTPPACGSYVAQGSLTPWDGAPAVTESSDLEIDSGPNGEACPSGAFGPSLTAGMASDRAGAFSSFSLTLSRRDGEQRFGAVTVRMPPGLLGDLRNVALCPQAQASQGTCPPASQIGTTTVGAGPGEDPLYLPAPDRPANAVYLTGPYAGAPFGLSIVVPEIAGPFNLGTVVVRAKVEVDPHTAALTVTSDPLPAIEQGIPLDVRTIAVNVDRADFMFNPTNCTPRTIAGAISSTGGVGAAVSSPFAAAGCASLPFRPVFSASTAARASKAGGVSLVVKVGAKGGPQPGGGEANISSVKVDLPRRLPSRLTTLQKACPAGVFAANPAACPAPSLVGAATASTPMLAQRLTGPAYLVSHGGAALPGLVIVLQGEGIVIDLEGQTNIERGVTSSTFRSLPDAPLRSFELVLGGGPHSLLGANLPARAKWSLCKQKLLMPTAITGQNGAHVKRTVRIGITGCPPTRAKPTRAKRVTRDKQDKQGGRGERAGSAERQAKRR